jgi:hypothetical protein
MNKTPKTRFKPAYSYALRKRSVSLENRLPQDRGARVDCSRPPGQLYQPPVMKGDLRLAQMIAGHSRFQTTADRYNHLLPDYVKHQVESAFSLLMESEDDE